MSLFLKNRSIEDAKIPPGMSPMMKLCANGSLQVTSPFTLTTLVFDSERAVVTRRGTRVDTTVDCTVSIVPAAV